ncbi:MAG: Arc family DNA-binding protein [Oscillospiraceae bacterium]|nr:Arc family DNA-binding protein [Oscillospiraceae bacterium]
MAVSKANQRAVNKYVKNNYDRVNVTMPKGRKEIIQAHAEAHSESVNGFINRAIQEAIERDNAAAGAAEGRTEDKERAGE